MLDKMKNLVVEEEGQGLTEYALIIALVSIAIVAVLVSFRGEIEGVFQGITNAFRGTK